MGLNLQEKEQFVFKISKVLERSLSVVVASIEGMRVNELTDLRALCRKSNVYVLVARNTLVCRVFKDTDFKCLCSLFVDSNVIGFSTVEASDCARIFVEFSKMFPVKFKIKGAVFDGVFIEESKINILSSLPTHKDCIVKLAFIFRECAIGRFIRLLHVLSSLEERRK